MIHADPSLTPQPRAPSMLRTAPRGWALPAGALALALGLALASGCSSVAKDGSRYARLSGRLTSYEQADLDTVTAATNSAMRQMALRPMPWSADGFSRLILGEVTFGPLAQEHELRIQLTRHSEGGTEVEIWIRGRRDEERLRLILAEIRKNLPSPAPAKPVPASGPASG